MECLTGTENVAKNQKFLLLWSLCSGKGRPTTFKKNGTKLYNLLKGTQCYVEKQSWKTIN